jgi:hypothetical protein
VPGALRKRDKLDDAAVAPNEQVRGYFHTANFSEIRMRIPVECVGKKRLDFRSSELAGREADAVHDDHGRGVAAWSRILVRAGALHRRLKQAGGFVDGE